MGNYEKIKLAADGTVASRDNLTLADVAIGTISAPLAVFSSDKDEFVSKQVAGTQALIGVGVGMLVQGFFRLLPINPIR